MVKILSLSANVCKSKKEKNDESIKFFLSIPNKLLYEWYSLKKDSYFRQLNAKLPSSVTILESIEKSLA